MMVADVMTRNPLYIHPGMSVPDAHAFMQREKVGRLPVLDGNNKLVGIVTERDLANATPSAATTLSIYEMEQLLSQLKVEKVMQKKVITIAEDVVIEEAARIMVDNNISALPVMHNDVLVGIVSDGDLFKLFINLFGARQPGVRLTILLPEHPGVLHTVSEKIVEKGGNVIAFVICDGPDVSSKKCIIKVANVDRETLITALQPVVLEIIDARQV